MNLKDFRLDTEALFSQVMYGDGYLHYGYWENCKPSIISLENLGKAQADYFYKFVKAIPDGVNTILDIGSGTGSNAAGLISKGYIVDCVCPSKNLNIIAANKLPKTTSIFECNFEEFSENRTYDMLLFSESFHYIDANVALKKGLECTNKFILIFDYFKKEDSVGYKRISYGQFNNLVEKSFNEVYEVIYDEDVTQNIIPTFLILDEISNSQLKPFIKTSILKFKKEHPVLGFFSKYFLNKMLHYSNNKSNRYKNFITKNEYRIILLMKK